MADLSQSWPVVLTAFIGATATLGGVSLSLRQGRISARELREHDAELRQRTWDREDELRIQDQRRSIYVRLLSALDEMSVRSTQSDLLDAARFAAFLAVVEEARLVLPMEAQEHVERVFRSVGPLLGGKRSEAAKLIGEARSSLIPAARKDLRS